MKKNKFNTSDFVCDKIAVEEAGAHVAFRKGMFKPDFNAKKHNVFCIGLDDDQRDDVALAIAQCFGMQCAKLTEESAEVTMLDKVSGFVFSVSESLLHDEKVRADIKNSGKVFYLMPEIATLVNGLAEDAREALLGRFYSIDPLCMMSLHFILQPGRTAQEQAVCAAEALGVQELSVTEDYEITWDEE